MEQAQKDVGKYIAALGNSNLSLGEIIIFDNHAYAQIIEKSTGVGALEVLVDPTTLSVLPEFGPTMMWNLKYGHMGSGGAGWGSMMGGSGRGSMMGNSGRGSMMGGSGYSSDPSQLIARQQISASEALQIAQQFLDASLPGTKVAEAADPFYR